MSFADAIRKRVDESDPLVPLDECGNLSRARLAVPAREVCVDFMDSVFVAFHAELKEYMLVKYGLLDLSEAHILHDVIAACLTPIPCDESDASECERDA